MGTLQREEGATERKNISKPEIQEEGAWHSIFREARRALYKDEGGLKANEVEA